MKNNNIDLYDIFIKYSYSQLKELFKKAKTKDEQDFYMALANLVLQKEQAKIISEKSKDNLFERNNKTLER